jgi:hypothetical protein
LVLPLSREDQVTVPVSSRQRRASLAPCGGARFSDARSHVFELLAHRAWNPPPSSSLAEEERLRSLLLRAAARDFPTLAAI